ncbi:MAG: lysylphosphatidylglycerol synthase domain-containing protein [Longimicrobiales bacterium]
MTDSGPSGSGSARSGAKMGSRIRGLGGFALRLVVTALVTWFIVRAVGLTLADLKAFDLSTLRPRMGLLLLSATVLLLGYLYAASLWGLLVKELGGPDVGTRVALRVFFTANLGRYLPGKVWQLAGLAYLARREGVPAGTATAAALLGQGFALAGATLVGLGVLLRGEWGWDVGGKWVAAVLLALLLVMTFPALLRPLLRTVIRRSKGSMPGALWPDQAFGVRWLGLYAVSWILQGGAFWILAGSFGMTLDPLLGLSVFPASYLLGYLALFAPAGIGVREGFLIVFLTPILGPGGAFLAVAARLWTTLVELGPALVLASGYVKSSRPRDQGDGSV